MTRTTHRVTSGLVFLGMRAFDIVMIGNRVCTTLDRLGAQIGGLSVQSDDRITIRTPDFELCIDNKADFHVATLERPAAHFLALTLTRFEPTGEEDGPCNQSIMAHVLQTLHRSLSPDYVQWIDPLALLSSADFEMATTMPEEEPMLEQLSCDDCAGATKIMSRRHILPSIEETNLMLQARLRSGDPVEGALRATFRKNQAAPRISTDDIREKTTPLRLTVWLLTITLGLFALPMAAALTVFNLLRGENLRLTSQTAALTGTFIAFQTFGTTASAMSALQSMLG
ncbi:hypothetical protein ROG8370_03542 [Roseovarius gaetbuli]|uniref:Uncharacterized protein n=2 Tax=Roseovarius gaetbuli TaxID=1356575 RepID=A0A1X7A8N4_9RHOB|nr:hypothetical protein ROG8370_03542 [Roseovarius gaetbuli]